MPYSVLKVNFIPGCTCVCKPTLCKIMEAIPLCDKIEVYIYIYIYIYLRLYTAIVHTMSNYNFNCVVYRRKYIQGVTGGTDQTSGGCSLC